MDKSQWVGIAIIAAVVVAAVMLFSQQETPQEPVVDVPQEPAGELDLGPETHDIQVRVSRAGYSPSEITVKRLDTLRLHIRTTDGLEHGLRIQGHNISAEIPPGEEVVVEFLATKTGQWGYYSHVPSFPGAGNLRGILTVEER